MANGPGVPRQYMANLNEYCQRRQLKLEYKDVSITGPPHDRVFTVMAVVEKREYPTATGKNKKEAKSHAAKLAWEAILQEGEESPSTASSPDVTSSPSTNYISLLNEYALKNKVAVGYPLKDKTGEDHKPNFSCACEINGKIYGEGKGKNKQMAKSNAARQAYEKLMAQQAFGPEQSATSINMSLCNSHETSEMASVNDTDSDSKCKGINGKLASEIDAMQINEVSSSPLAVSRAPAVKQKRKDTQLAPTFSKLHQSECTNNERFLELFVDIERIGHGAFGRVFKAKHKIDNKMRAVKRVKLSLNEKEMKKAEEEVKVLADLQHENIVRYYGCWIGKDSIGLEDSMSNDSLPHDFLFIEMEFCEKGTLKRWMDLKRGTERCKEDSLMKFRQIVEGVAYIHSKKLIHRDLKPLNILISKEDKIKISDFGLVTSGVDDPSVQRTENRGTKSYMAPEQAGKRYGKEVDIFPLGLILFEMLYIFETENERAKEWPNIKECDFPQTFMEKFPVEALQIKKMLSEEPCKRPTAIKILEFLNQGQQNSIHTC